MANGNPFDAIYSSLVKNDPDIATAFSQSGLQPTDIFKNGGLPAADAVQKLKSRRATQLAGIAASRKSQTFGKASTVMGYNNDIAALLYSRLGGTNSLLG